MSLTKRVLYFSRDLTTHDFRFLTSLANTALDVYYLRLEKQNASLQENSLPKKVKNLPGLTDHINNGSENFSLLVDQLREIIHQVNPDILHAGPIQSCGFLSALTGFSPLITMSWGSDILVASEKDFLWRWVTDYTLNKTSVLLGDCQVVKMKAIQFGFSENRIVLFPWGIDLRQYQPGKNLQFRERLGWADKFVLLSNRSWERLYGVEIVAKAFVAAAQSKPNLRLILLGSGSQKKEITKIFEEAGMIDRVHFGGVVAQKNLPDYLHAADLYLSASFSDGSSVSLMEALACGLPVLVSDIPGNQEWIDQDRNGWIFETGNVENLKNSILEIYKTQYKLPIISQEARKTAEKKANWEDNFQKLLFAYQLVLGSDLTFGEQSD
jgi:glycosyltransferase involved in cell wall biosynthesis